MEPAQLAAGGGAAGAGRAGGESSIDGAALIGGSGRVARSGRASPMPGTTIGCVSGRTIRLLPAPAAAPTTTPPRTTLRVAFRSQAAPDADSGPAAAGRCWRARRLDRALAIGLVAAGAAATAFRTLAAISAVVAIAVAIRLRSRLRLRSRSRSRRGPRSVRCGRRPPRSSRWSRWSRPWRLPGRSSRACAADASAGPRAAPLPPKS